VVGAIAGIALIGLFNFSVSYSLSLAVAARAREVKWSVVRRLLRAMRARLRNRPSDFFLPPRAPSAPLTEPVHRLPALAPELPDGGHR
jgi:site-specific recombinase